MFRNTKREKKKTNKVNGSTYILLEKNHITSCFLSLFPSLPAGVVFCKHASAFLQTALLQHCLAVMVEARQWISSPPGSAYPKQSRICLVAANTQTLATMMLSANAHLNSQLWSFIQTIIWQFPDAHLFVIEPSHSVLYCLQTSSTETLVLGIQFGLIKKVQILRWV